MNFLLKFTEMHDTKMWPYQSFRTKIYYYKSWNRPVLRKLSHETKKMKQNKRKKVFSCKRKKKNWDLFPIVTFMWFSCVRLTFFFASMFLFFSFLFSSSLAPKRFSHSVIRQHLKWSWTKQSSKPNKYFLV